LQRHGEQELYKPGDVIGGKYEVHHRLGKGGFGIVYLVYARELRGAAPAWKRDDAKVRRRPVTTNRKTY